MPSRLGITSISLPFGLGIKLVWSELRDHVSLVGGTTARAVNAHLEPSGNNIDAVVSYRLSNGQTGTVTIRL